MSEIVPVVFMFICAVAGMAAVIYVNISLVRKKIKRWDLNASVWFAMSLGRFGEKQRAMWRREAGYNRAEADIIIKYQLLCFLETPIGFAISGLLVSFLGPYNN